jgi:hypothetical protein
MTINASVLQNIHPLKIQSPIERFTTGLQLKNLYQSSQAGDLELQQKQQTMAKAQRIQEILVRHSGDVEKALPEINQVDPTLGGALAKQHQDYLNAGLTGEKTQADINEANQKITFGKSAEERAAAEEARKVAAEQRAIDDAKRPKKIDEYINKSGKRVLAMQYPDGTVKYEEGQEVGATPSATPPAAPRTTTTAEGVMQWNPATQKYDIKVGNRPPTAAQITAAATANPPGDWNKTGDEFLNSIPAQWRQTVKKIAHYDEDPTKVASMRGGMREQLMQWVNQVNPAYNSVLFGNLAPARKAFTTGTQGQQINAINTAIGHIDQITKLAAGLNNGSFVPGNEFYNWAKTTFGEDAVTNFDTLKDALAGEVASVLSKGGATVSGIADAKEKIKAASSPQQLAGYVKTLIPVMGSKLNAFDYEYQQATGGNDPTFSMLSPESKSILTKYGFDPQNPLSDTGAGMIHVLLNGREGEIPASQWDAFKKENPSATRK